MKKMICKNGLCFCELENVDQLKQLHYLTTCSTKKYNYVPFKPRWINMIYAFICGYFWLPCHKCGNHFGGHEWFGSSGNTGVCPECVLKTFNETGKFDE